VSRHTGVEITSYAGGIASIVSSLTLTDVGVIVGIATALLTFLLNAIYMYRKDKREQRAADAALRFALGNDSAPSQIGRNHG
jgi:cbb3-type cytochrome oxidase subunit 3